MVLEYRSTETGRSWLGQTAILIFLLVIAAPVGARAQPPDGIAQPGAIRPATWPRLRLADPVGRQAAGQALDLAWERLAQPDCSALLTAFRDQSGGPLAQRLDELSVDLQTYLTLLIVVDGSRDGPCVEGAFAFTTPGNRVIRVCLDELKRVWRIEREHAVMSFIHEMLHSLGLGENPPSSAEITRRVFAACRRPR